MNQNLKAIQSLDLETHTFLIKVELGMILAHKRLIILCGMSPN